MNEPNTGLPAPLPADVLQPLMRGNKVEAIKRLRIATGMGLKEARDAVDAAARTMASTGGRPARRPARRP